MDPLIVYVARHCFGYEQALKLVQEINQKLPQIVVEVRIIDETTVGDFSSIPATPSYFLGSRLLFLGNPRLEMIEAKLASLGLEKGPEDGKI